MTGILDFRLSSSSDFMDAIRRAEYAVLLIMSASCVLLPEYETWFAMPLAILALMLVPKPAVDSPNHERRRLNTLNEVLGQGLQLRSQWLTASESQASEGTPPARETILWIYRCSQSLRPFPEVAGIFEAHESKEDLSEELDSCLRALSQIRRLVSMSESLKLPISP